MPRNPNKSRCRAPGCRNWAMRGSSRCRSHRDRELGPRGGGAPQGNLNAIKTGDHAHPLSDADLREFARRLVSQPEELPEILNLVIRSVHSRVRDPYDALVALRVALPCLGAEVAACLFATEAKPFLLRLPPAERVQALYALQRRRIRHLSPEAALRWLRDLITDFDKKRKQVPVQAQPSPRADRIIGVGERYDGPST